PLRRAWRSSAGTPSSSTARRCRLAMATLLKKSDRSSGATAMVSPFASATGVSATSTSAKSPPPAVCQCSICRMTCITRSRLSPAKDHAVYMHCLPADRNIEVTDEVLDGPQSIVYDEAENRLHVQKAAMALTMR